MTILSCKWLKKRRHHDDWHLLLHCILILTILTINLLPFPNLYDVHSKYKRVLMGYEFPQCIKDSNIRLLIFPLLFWCGGNYCSRALQTKWNEYNAALVYDIKAEILKRKDKDRHYCLTLYSSIDMYKLTLLWNWPALRKDSVFDLQCHQLLQAPASVPTLEYNIASVAWLTEKMWKCLTFFQKQMS